MSLGQLVLPTQPCQSGPVILRMRKWSPEYFKMASGRCHKEVTSVRGARDAGDPALRVAHTVPSGAPFPSPWLRGALGVGCWAC